MNCLCSGRSNKVDHFLAETLATPPDIQDDDHLSKRIFQRISTVVSPREVARDSSYLVNVDATTSSHATPSVRRMSSLRLPLPSNDGYRFSQGKSLLNHGTWKSVALRAQQALSVCLTYANALRPGNPATVSMQELKSSQLAACAPQPDLSLCEPVPLPASFLPHQGTAAVPTASLVGI